jgi:hypothetical protein
MARLASVLAALGLALTSACFVEDPAEVQLDDVAVTGEAPALTADEVKAAEPCSAMLAATLIARDLPRDEVLTGRSCINCHAVPGTIPKGDGVTLRTDR